MAYTQFFITPSDWNKNYPEIYHWFENQGRLIDWWTGVQRRGVYPICINNDEDASALFKLTFAHLITTPGKDDDEEVD